MSGRKPIVAVIGPGECDAGTAAVAARVGELVARRGCVLVTGGRTGVMEAASRGAAGAGGVVLGILPGESADEANAHVQNAIVTGLGEARNAVIARTADGVIAIGRGYGTLSEIAFALKFGKPVASLGSWEVDGSVTPAASAEEAVRLVLERIEGGQNPTTRDRA